MDSPPARGSHQYCNRDYYSRAVTWLYIAYNAVLVSSVVAYACEQRLEAWYMVLIVCALHFVVGLVSSVSAIGGLYGASRDRFGEFSRAEESLLCTWRATFRQAAVAMGDTLLLAVLVTCVLRLAVLRGDASSTPRAEGALYGFCAACALVGNAICSLNRAL